MPTISKIQSFGLPVGSVVQTVPVSEMTATSYTGVDSSNPQTLMSGTITPTSASHKILLFGFASIGGLYSNYSSGFHYLGLRLKRGSTVIGETDDLSSATTMYGADSSGARPMHSVFKDAGYSASRPQACPFHFMDSPNTTSAVTYNIQGVIERDGHTHTLVRNIGGYRYNTNEQASSTCQLTLMEIVA